MLSIVEVPFAVGNDLAFLLVPGCHRRTGYRSESKELSGIYIHLPGKQKSIVYGLRSVGVRAQDEHPMDSNAHIMKSVDGRPILFEGRMFVVKLQRLVVDRLQTD